MVGEVLRAQRWGEGKKCRDDKEEEEEENEGCNRGRELLLFQRGPGVGVIGIPLSGLPCDCAISHPPPPIGSSHATC